MQPADPVTIKGEASKRHDVVDVQASGAVSVDFEQFGLIHPGRSSLPYLRAAQRGLGGPNVEVGFGPGF